jgi:hypothetical protein
MSAIVIENGAAYNITATGNVGAGTTRDLTLLGFYVNNTTAGTLVLRKGGSGGTAISGTITPAIGFHRFPASVPAGLHATIGGALDVTFFVLEGQA